MADYFLAKHALAGTKHEPMPVTGKPSSDPSFIHLDKPFNYGIYKLGRDVFESQEDAKKAILAMRDKKLLSLRKQIAKLETIGKDW